MNNTPTNPDDHEEVDPFSDLGESVPELSADDLADFGDPDASAPTSDMARDEAGDGVTELGGSTFDEQPMDTAKFLDADEIAPAAGATAPITKTKPKNAVRLALFSVSALVVAIIGWLGWSYWVDHEALATLQSDLMNARDQADSTKSDPTDAGEIAAASQLAARAAIFNDAPWWDCVAVRFIDQQSLDTATTEAAELGQAAQRRKANRAWYAEQNSTIDGALAVEDRTIASLQGLKDDFQAAQAPNANDGGYTDELISQLATRIDSDIAQLVQDQDKNIASFNELLESIDAAPTLEVLASASVGLTKPLPIDRNPPEFSEAMSKIRQQAKLVELLLIARDTLQTDLGGKLAELNATDVETVSLDALTSGRAQIAALPLADDGRFNQVRQLKQECLRSADGLIEVVSARDAALAWIAESSSELAAMTRPDEMPAFIEKLSTANPTASDLLVVQNAMQTLAAQVAARAEMMAAETLKVEESIARAAVCSESLSSVDRSIQSVKFSAAADEILTIVPETDQQFIDVAKLKKTFPQILLKSLTNQANMAKRDGNWAQLAGYFRQCLASDSIRLLDPRFEQTSTKLWETVRSEEDRSLYGEIQRRSRNSYDELAPIALWYLDPTRTKGASAPMRSQVAALMESIARPTVTLQIEGVDWESVGCDLLPNEPTFVAVNILQSPPRTEYYLSVISSLATTMLERGASGDHELTMDRTGIVDISINGRFGCADGSGSFTGSGALTMDVLRTGGRFTLPFWSGNDQSIPPHHLLIISIPDEDIRVASNLPAWNDGRPSAPADSLAPAVVDAPQDPPSQEAPPGF